MQTNGELHLSICIELRAKCVSLNFLSVSITTVQSQSFTQWQQIPWSRQLFRDQLFTNIPQLSRTIAAIMARSSQSPG